MFADDTSLYIEVDNEQDAVLAMNQDLANIQEWANQWLITFCPSKTKLMTCSFKNRTAGNLVFNNIQLESIFSHKHLGLTLSNDLSWSNHIKSIIGGISPMIDILTSYTHISTWI